MTICRNRPTGRERPSFSAGRSRETAPGFSCEALPCHLSRRPRIPLSSDFSHPILLFAASPFTEKSEIALRRITRKHRVSLCLVRSQHMFPHKEYLFKRYISSRNIIWIFLLEILIWILIINIFMFLYNIICHKTV